MSHAAATGKLWMWGIILALLLSGSFFVGLAVWAFQSDVELVYDNYYAKDVVFEQQIRRVERTEALPQKPVLRYRRQSETLSVRFPREMNLLDPRGSILLFRPSDLHLDRKFDLDLQGDSLQIIQLPDLLPGLWRIKLNWTNRGQEYYLEEMLVLN